MKRLVAAFALFLAAQSVFASGPFGTKENYMLGKMFTYGGNFGFPPYAADPFTCNSTTKRTTYYNTASNTAKFCNGTSWVSLLSTAAPVTQAQGGFGVDMSSPASIYRQLKNLGTGGTNGGVSAVTFLTATVAASQTTGARIEILTVTSDGTHNAVAVAAQLLACSRESGTTTVGFVSATGTQTIGGPTTTAGSLALSAAPSVSHSDATGVCTFTITIPVSVGTATSNTLYYTVEPLGQGAWAAQ